MTAMKRQASCFYAHTHNDDADSASNKRRRQNEEFQYTATTIQTALADAGHPPMSIFPLGSVDMERARVMTSCEDDCAEAEITLNGGAKKQEDQLQVEENDGETQADDPNCDVSSMCIIASLIQSTQH